MVVQESLFCFNTKKSVLLQKIQDWSGFFFSLNCHFSFSYEMLLFTAVQTAGIEIHPFFSFGLSTWGTISVFDLFLAENQAFPLMTF